MMNLAELAHRDDFPLWLTRHGFTGTGVELGVFRGWYSNRLLNGWDGKLIGIDCYNGGVEFDILMDAIRINQSYIDSGRYRILVCDTLSGALKVESGLDFAFIDADHSAVATWKDIQAWWPKIRPGGILCGHDYDAVQTGVSDAVKEFVSTQPGLPALHVAQDGSWFIQKQV